MDLSWMGWTLPTAIFFTAIGTSLLVMIIWGIVAPQPPRRGILRLMTTPGDRLFISLLGSAFICLLWLGLVGPSMTWALIMCLLFSASVFKWV